MGYSAQAGQVGLKTQGSRGVYTSPGTGGMFTRLRSGGLGTNRNLLVPDPEVGGSRDVADNYLGAASWSGDYEFYGRNDLMLMLLKAGLGNVVTATTTGVTTHTITGLDTPALPFLSVEERIGSGLETYNYTDAVVNALHLESDANGYVQGTATLLAAKQVSGATPSGSPVWDTSPIMTGPMVTVTYNSVALPARSFSFDLANNFEDDDFRLGSFYLGDMVPKSRNVTFGFSVRPNDSNLWRQAIYGSSASTQVTSGVTLKQPLVITLTSYETISGGTPTTPYSVSFTVPSALVQPFSFEPSGDDIITNDIVLSAVRPALGTPLMTVVGKTGLALLP